MLDLHLPSVETAQAADQALNKLSGHAPACLVVHVSDSGGVTEVVLPIEVLPVLLQTLDHLARGRGVRVLPLEAELTTQQAAELLHMSRPHLVRLLDQGKLAFHWVGTHHRLKLSDVVAFKAERDARREDALRELAQEGQDLGLG